MSITTASVQIAISLFATQKENIPFNRTPQTLVFVITIFVFLFLVFAFVFSVARPRSWWEEVKRFIAERQNRGELVFRTIVLISTDYG